MSPFWIDHQQIGWIKREHQKVLRRWATYFEITAQAIYLHSSLSTPDARSAALATVVAELKQSGNLPNQPSEIMAVSPDWGKPPLFWLERSAAAVLGVPVYDVCVNGTYHHNQLFIWIVSKPPLMEGLLMSHLSGNATPAQTMITQSWLKTRLPLPIAKKAVTCGWISYLNTTMQGVIPGKILVYDLLLPDTVLPRPNSREGDNFLCLSAKKVVAWLKHTRQFQGISVLVMIDFLLRHRVIDTNEPDYEDLKRYLQHEFLFETPETAMAAP